MNRALQAIVFDFDGVIADSERLHLRAYQEVLEPEGVTLTEEAYYTRYLGYDDVGVLRKLGEDTGVPMSRARVAALVERKGERYEALAAAGEMLFPGAAAFVRAASEAVPIAIASGALTREIEDVLVRAGLRHVIPVIVGADQTAHSKPHPEPYRTAFARLREATGRPLEPWRSVAIEDSKWGLVSARGADLRCVAVTTTYSAEELREDAELVVPGLHALTLEALDRLVND
jgi:beta-phosphoglucomutase-like phosphatase (HAD superfamily)